MRCGRSGSGPRFVPAIPPVPTISHYLQPAERRHLPSGRNHGVRGDLLRSGQRARHAATRPLSCATRRMTPPRSSAPAMCAARARRSWSSPISWRQGTKQPEASRPEPRRLSRPAPGITAAADGSAAASTLTASSYIQASGSRSKVDGSFDLSGGVCERTLQVRNAIVAKVEAATDCSQVNEEHLTTLTGRLLVEGLTSIAAGDFAGLSGITGAQPPGQRHQIPARGPARRARVAHRVKLSYRADPSAEGYLPRARRAHRTQPEQQPTRRRRPAGRHLRAADKPHFHRPH